MQSLIMVSNSYRSGSFQEVTEVILDNDIQFAVFDGGKEITPQMYEEVKNFAAFVAERNKDK